jgi:hypothetical protein
MRRVRVNYTVELTDDIHRGLEHHYGRHFVSTRDALDTLRYFCEGNGRGALDDIKCECDASGLNCPHVSEI